MIKQLKLSFFTSCLFVLILIVNATANAAKDEGCTAKQVSKDFIAVAKTAVPAVVSIRTKGPESKRCDRFYQTPFGDIDQDLLDYFFGGRFKGQSSPRQESPWMGQASGFIVSRDGYILTNNHVVQNAGHIKVVLNNGKEFDAKIVGQDPHTDIAVIKIDGEELPYLELGNSDDLEVGQWVVAIGTPLGLQASLTVGVVSAKGRNNLDLATIEDFIQTDAAINRGNSGGPLLDLEGKVVGINTAIASTMGGYMGIGFAIPSNIAQQIMHQIIDDGSAKRGYLGIVLQSIDQDLANAFGLSKAEGVLVAEVSKSSPAYKAGVHQGDIILKYQSTEVKNIAALRNAIALMSPGTQVKLTLLRDGRTLVIPVEIGAFPKAFAANGAPAENRLGFEVEELTPEIAQNLGILNDKGVIVSYVRPGSPAAWTGMKKGALILEVNKQKVNSTRQFDEILQNTPPERPILLLIRQEGQMRFLSLKVG